MNHELLVIGSGRDAIENALAGVRRRQRVALVLPMAGGTEVPSITFLRQAVDNLDRELPLRLSALRNEMTRISQHQRVEVLAKLNSAGVDVFIGEARFLDAHSVEVHQGSEITLLRADNILLACGTTSARPAHIPFDGQRVLDAESLFLRDELPASIIVVGAGETGLDYAWLLGSLGVEVTVIDERASALDVYGGLMNDARLMEMQSLAIAFRLGDEVIGVETRGADRTAVRVASGKVFTAEAVLVCIGRVGDTEALNLEAAGVGLDERGRVWCDADGGTWASHIRAIGDVVGFRATSALAG